MSEELSIPLGLAKTSMFANEPWIPPGEHFVLLDGVRGSFCLSELDKLDDHIDAKSWAWSAGVLHHVTMTSDHVVVQRWDRTEIARYRRRSVIEQRDRFYAYIANSQPDTTRTLAIHAVDAFSRLRSNFPNERQDDALAVFLLLLGGILTMQDYPSLQIYERAGSLSSEFSLTAGAPDALKEVSQELIQHFVSTLRTPLLTQSTNVITLPSFMVRHAGAVVFQQAHFELVQRGTADLFGVPDPARLAEKTASGVHFTPPGVGGAPPHK